jgi:hypothetical protein
VRLVFGFMCLGHVKGDGEVWMGFVGREGGGEGFLLLVFGSTLIL